MDQKNLLDTVTRVDPTKQLKNNDVVEFEHLDGTGLRVLFVGNSITLHGIAHDIGWHWRWGMAATAKEKDYVHLCMSHMLESHPDAAFGICQVSRWERNYKTGSETFPEFENAREFDPDVIIIKLSANCPHEDFDENLFYDRFAELIAFLSKSGKAKTIVCTGFYKHPAEPAILRYAADTNQPLVMLSDLAEMDEMKAIGRFEHGGVASHPGDLGMETIAKRICEVFDREF